MKYAALFGFVVLITVSSCVQKTSGKYLNEHTEFKKVKFKSGLTIENGINRGTDYKDSLDTKYNVRYIPINIKNDTSLSIELQLSFLPKYTYPFNTTDKFFNLIPMTQEWAVDGGGITENMFIDLQKDIDNPRINIFLKPGAEFLFSIGTRYHRGIGYVAPLPEFLFVYGEMYDFKFCDSLLTGEQLKSNKEIGLKLIFYRGKNNEHCAIIPCGKIKYIEN